MTTLPRNHDELLVAVARGKRFKYLHFWSHKPARPVGAECLSQWYAATFEVGGRRYATAEHWMMAEKARLFGDDVRLHAILGAAHPGEAKRLGREVQGFSEDSWQAHRVQIVVQGNLHKFSQNPELSAFLLGTGKRILVESSPHDRIWGTGLAASHAHAEHPQMWRGENLLGFALMAVRERLRA